MRLIAARSPEWAAWLRDVPHDFHHTAAHHRAWEQAGHGTGWLAVVGTETRFLAWPYLLRKIDVSAATAREDLYDITAVDGYAGPLARGCRPGDPFLDAALETLFEHWRRSRVVSVFARFHPLLENHRWVHDCPAGSCTAAPRHPCPYFQGLRHEGHTVSIDLRLTCAEASQEYRRDHRHDIRQARRLGVTSEVDNSPEAFGVFVRLYHQTMQRNHASPHYFFSERFLEDLFRAVAPGGFIHLARLDGKVLAATFVTEYSGIVQYLFSGAEEDAYRLSPHKTLLDDVRSWARARCNHTLHLGGGRGGCDADSLFLFKSGFSSRRHCYHTGRWILDRSWYDRLAGEHGGAEASECSFFPAYRAPLGDVLEPVGST
ncbi:MAG: GNAT family N-acetyltransferase [Acidobacteria bacterium]|nr:GNAT family N-acetyltransferase [Acidobacteriota bacterium]